MHDLFDHKTSHASKHNETTILDRIKRDMDTPPRESMMNLRKTQNAPFFAIIEVGLGGVV